MTPDRWRQIEEVFQAAADQPPGSRAAFLDEACNGDTGLRREVESLLGPDDEPESAIHSAISGVSESLVNEQSEPVVGRRIGAYRVTGVIGRGGMGSVYLAVRADDHYEKKVAIKLVKRGMDTDFIVGRFRAERQILASLEHPRIARLLDGGATEDGLPYFVMEHIDGKPIAHYCDDAKLSIPERLKLFRLVCSAVQYAHQNLVVHRDLKPSNILVIREGVPKLLDFGIAKLLKSDANSSPTAQTANTLRLMTPDYASPEQVRGESVTTATDIYSLGAILYELLTGQKPHHFKNYSPTEIERAICHEDTERPSAAISRTVEAPAKVRRQLAGDLDNIVLMAMRKEPARRYNSADQFSEDIRRHLDGQPVIARKDTISYRTGKFVQRHKFSIAAAALVLASLVGGIVTTAYQARRAERRFQQVRRLANSFLFDHYERIKNLPGSLAAREALVRTGLEYLDSLAGESAGDGSLQQELAEAYRRVGDVQGHVLSGNLGNTTAALQSYGKAQAILENLLFREPQNATAKTVLAELHSHVGDVLSYTGNLGQSVEHYNKGLALVRTIAPNAERRRKVAQLDHSLATVQVRMGDIAAALETSSEALSTYELLVAAAPSDQQILMEISSAYSNQGSLLLRSGDLATALKNYQKAVTIRERLTAEDPSNVLFARDLMIGYGHIGDVLGSPTKPNLGDPAGALASYTKMLTIAESISASNPSDNRALSDYAIALMRVGNLIPEDGDNAKALATFSKSIGIMEELASTDAKNARLRMNMVFVYHRLADRQLIAGNRAAAFRNYQKSIALGEALVKADPKDIENRRVLEDTYRRYRKAQGTY
ncbi:MAG: protein kinase [Bryobacteraceae bacterium]